MVETSPVPSDVPSGVFSGVFSDVVSGEVADSVEVKGMDVWTAIVKLVSGSTVIGSKLAGGGLIVNNETVGVETIVGKLQKSASYFMSSTIKTPWFVSGIMAI